MPRGRKMSFQQAAKNAAYLKERLKRSQDASIVNHLLMVDIGIECEGNTQSEEEGIRKTKALLEKHL